MNRIALREMRMCGWQSLEFRLQAVHQARPPEGGTPTDVFSPALGAAGRLCRLIVFLLTAGLSPAADTVVLKNGRKVACEVADVTDEGVKLRVAAGTPGASLLPAAEVDHVLFAPLPGEEEALRKAVKDGAPEPLMLFYVKRLPLLNRPRSNSGELGLVYAELLTRVPTPDRLERALKVYQQISEKDWDTGRRGRAAAGRLRVLLRQGKVEEVMPQAERLLEESGDPRVMIEVRHVMAEGAAARLKQLMADHPRWEEEDEIIPERERLLNEAVDGYLFPHLFHGAEEDLAARGLWAAATLVRDNGDVEQAAAWGGDLRRLYPASPEAAAVTGKAEAVVSKTTAEAKTTGGTNAETNEEPEKAEKGSRTRKPRKKKNPEEAAE